MNKSVRERVRSRPVPGPHVTNRAVDSGGPRVLCDTEKPLELSGPGSCGERGTNSDVTPHPLPPPELLRVRGEASESQESQARGGHVGSQPHISRLQGPKECRSDSGDSTDEHVRLLPYEFTDAWSRSSGTIPHLVTGLWELVVFLGKAPLWAMPKSWLLLLGATSETVGL